MFGDVLFNPLASSVEFDHVWFKYEGRDEWALQDVSFRIDAGETAVFVGAPGSGKSTINKLILRLYRPVKGSIMVGGRDVFEYENNSYRKYISAIEQEVFLFSETIDENLKFGFPDATEEVIRTSIQMAQAEKFINTFPKKLQTEIGERGVKLSGGEKQRLAIARALLMNPSVLLMDDASSALDAKTELEIQEAIENILRTRTSIITTHRLSIISRATKVVLINDGRIVAIGTHIELLEKQPEYRRLFVRKLVAPTPVT